MSDTLRQVGKQLRKNQNSTVYNTARYARNFPLIERVRDSICSSVSFWMELKVLPDQKTRVTITFLEPFSCGGIG